MSLSRGGKVLKNFSRILVWMGQLSIHAWDVVGSNHIFVAQIGWILFMANAGGSNFYQAVHLVKGISLRHPLIRWHGSFGAELTFPA